MINTYRMRVSVTAPAVPRIAVVTALIAELLRRRLRTAGADPLLTWYDLGAGQRVELSAVTVANWVDKTSNLLVDELGVDAGDVVELRVAQDAPGHWMTGCWELACWQLGLVVSVGSGLPARVTVAGPDPGSWAAAAGVLVACSLHPLGLGFAGPLPPEVIDFAVEVRGQPDTFAALPQSGLAPAWADGHRQVTQAELVADLDEPPRRRLVRPADPWTTARAGVVAALVTGGSAVLVVGGDDAELARVAAEERAGG
jgi:uncharacterized protein (TIGR03089 family)